MPQTQQPCASNSCMRACLYKARHQLDINCCCSPSHHQPCTHKRCDGSYRHYHTHTHMCDCLCCACCCCSCCRASLDVLRHPAEAITIAHALGLKQQNQRQQVAAWSQAVAATRFDAARIKTMCCLACMCWVSCSRLLIPTAASSCC
jgi:hypothetical protein